MRQYRHRDERAGRVGECGFQYPSGERGNAFVGDCPHRYLWWLATSHSYRYVPLFGKIHRLRWASQLLCRTGRSMRLGFRIGLPTTHGMDRQSMPTSSVCHRLRCVFDETDCTKRYGAGCDHCSRRFLWTARSCFAYPFGRCPTERQDREFPVRRTLHHQFRDGKFCRSRIGPIAWT